MELLTGLRRHLKATLISLPMLHLSLSLGAHYKTKSAWDGIFLISAWDGVVEKLRKGLKAIIVSEYFGVSPHLLYV